MSKTVTVKLATPLSLTEDDPDAISELTFRAPRASDMRGIVVTMTADGLRFDLGALIDLAAKLSNENPAYIGRADLGDLARIVEAVAPLLPDFLSAGS